MNVFVDGAFSQAIGLRGTVGDVQFCNGRWIAGSWRHALVAIDPRGESKPLMDVEMGIMRIAVAEGSDRFAVADLSGGIAFYSTGNRILAIPPQGRVRSIAFAGSRLAVMLDDSLVLIGSDGKCGAPDARPQFRNAHLMPSPIAGSCLLLCRDGGSLRIEQSGKVLRYLDLPSHATIISGCSLPERHTLKFAEGGCAYWKNGRIAREWRDAVAARLSPDGRLVAVAFENHVSVFEDRL